VNDGLLPHQRLQARHRAAGLCMHCGAAAMPQLSRCERHHREHIRRERDRQRRRIERGLCRDCGRPRGDSTSASRCAACLARNRRRATRGRSSQARLLVESLRALTTDDWSAPELAEHLGVNVRTAWRILATLRGLLPLERTRDGVVTYYRLPRRWWEQ
jgi:hypothetical protein